MRATTNPYYQGPKSDHFDGVRFHNQVQNKQSLSDFLRWRFTRDPKTWPEIPAFQEFDIPPPKVPESSLRAAFVGQSSMLLQTANLNILTDPIWSTRASPVSWFGPKRSVTPGIVWEDLPKIDAVLISHNHYDHTDLPTIERLIKRDNPKFIVGLGLDTFLRNSFPSIGVTALDWGDSYELTAQVKIFFLPMQHWSARGIFDRRQTLWGAFVVQAPGGNIYFAGDTGYTEDFKKAAERFGEFSLAILPIGSYEPRWFMKYLHLNPEEALQAHLDLKAEQSLGIHWGTFPLADEGFDEPSFRLLEALRKRQLPQTTFLAMRPGQVWQFGKSR
jgi:L-ascorbate metabolism protein UlaG (beta-lactamase superfamily)